MNVSHPRSDSFFALAHLRLVVILVIAVSVGGCEPPTAPTLSNPFDPEFTGTAIPTPPSELVLSGSGPGEVSISWLDNSSFEDGYIIERAPAADTNFVEIARVDPDETTFTDYDVELTRSYSYRAYSFHEGRKSIPSGPVSVRHAGRSTVEIPEDATCAIINELRFSPDGLHLVTGGYTGFLLGTEPLRLLGSLGAYAWDPFHLAYTDDGSYFATGDVGRVDLWNAEGLLVRRLEYSTEEIRAHHLDFSPGGDALAYAWGDADVRIWDWQADRIDAIPNPRYPTPIRGLAYVQDGDAVMTLVDGRLLTLSPLDGALISETPLAGWAGISEFTEVAFNADGSLLAAPVGNQVMLWRTATGAMHSDISTPEQTSVHFSTDVLVAYGGSRVHFYEAADGSLWREYSFGEVGEQLHVATVSSDRRYMAAVLRNGPPCEPGLTELSLWDLQEGWETVRPPNIDGVDGRKQNASASPSPPAL